MIDKSALNMTVNKVGTSTTKTKKKSASSTTAASTSKTTTTKTSKVVGGSSTTQTGNISKSSSSSSLQISDVSHLPVNANVVTYVVTETLPAGTGEKITTYGESGATSTEYRHYIAQDSSSKHSTDIQQIGSILNQSTSNLSQVSGSTYTVTEPMEELKLTYNKNDSSWNGKFVYEQPIQKGKKTKNQLIKSDGGTTVEQSSTSTSHQESSSKVQSSSSSYVVEIVDGKERIVDQKHHESAHATQSSNDEHLATKSGTNIVPEVHYTQKARDSETKYDTAVPELKQPKTKSSQAMREIHQVGDQTTSSVNVTHDNAISDSSKHSIRDKTKNFIDTEKTDIINKQIDTSSNAKTATSSTENTQMKSKNLGGSSTVTTTTTYYDSKGNVIKTVSDVDTQQIPGSKTEQTSSKTTRDAVDKRKTHIISDSAVSDNIKSFVKDSDSTTTYVDENYVDTSKIRSQQTTTDSKNFYGHSVDSRNTVVKDVYDTSAVQNVIGTKGRIIKDNTIDSTDIIYSNDRNYGKTGWNGNYETPEKPKREGPVTSTPRRPGSPERKPSPSRKSPDGKTRGRSDSPSKKTSTDSKNYYGSDNTTTEDTTTTTYYVDEDYVDTNKIRNAQTSTDSNNFYGHGIDSSNTVVNKTYDTRAVQNTIGTKGKVIIDQNIDNTDIIYSNDRNYGKTGWNGQFTYEQPQQPKKDSQRPDSPQRKLSPSKKPDKKSPDELPAAGAPSRKDTPGKKGPEDKKPRKSESPSRRKEKKSPDELPAAGMPSKRDEWGKKIPQKPAQQPEEPTKKSRKYPEELPVAGMPSKKPTKQTQDFLTMETNENIKQFTDTDRTIPRQPIDFQTSSTTVEHYETVDDHTDTKTSIIKDSKTSVDSKVFSDTSNIIEYYTIVDGQKVPIRPGGPQKITGPVYSTDSTTEYSEFVTDTRDSKINIFRDSKTFVDNTNVVESYTVVDGKRVPLKPGEKRPIGDKSRKPERIFPDELPAAGMPSNRGKKPQKSDQVQPRDKQYPSDSTTTTDYYESITDVRDSKINIVRDSKTFKDTTNIIEEYTIVNGKRVPLGPGNRKPLEEKPRKPEKVNPDELPAAGMPSRIDKKPQKPNQLQLRDKNIPDSTTTTEYYENVTDIRDSKTTLVRDSKIFKDTTNIVEEYIIVDGKRQPVGPGGRRPIDDKAGPNDKLVPKMPKDVSTDTTTTDYFESTVDIKDSKSVVRDSKTFVDTTNIVEEFTIINGKKVPVESKKSPNDKLGPKKPNKKSPDELPAAGMPSRREKKTPDDKKPIKRGESPSKKKKGPEDYPAAGKPSRTDSPSRQKPTDDKLVPRKSPRSPVTDSRTVTESYESVTNITDSKTTVVKDSQTFVDTQKSVEHYTTTDSYDSAKPRGPKDAKPIEDKPGRRGPGKPVEEFPKKPKGPKDGKSTSNLIPKDFPDDVTFVENYEVINNVTDVKSSVTEDITSKTIIDKKTIVEDYTTDIRDTTVVDTVDRVNKTFIKEDIIDIKDIVSILLNSTVQVI